MNSWAKELPWNEINFYANRWDVDPNMIAAFIMKESYNNQYAMRHEPNWKYLCNQRDFAEKLKITVGTEVICQSSSWGLMQVMGTVARELGFQGHLPMLVEIPLNLSIGVQKFKKLMQKYGDLHDAVSAYNQGNNRKTPGGMYENQRYVDEWFSFYNQLKK